MLNRLVEAEIKHVVLRDWPLNNNIDLAIYNFECLTQQKKKGTFKSASPNKDKVLNMIRS